MTHPLFDIRGWTALVTGSSRGIGRALAQALLEAGCTVVLHCTHPDDVASAAGQLGPTAERSGGAVHHLTFDVTDPESVAAGVAHAQDLAGPLDVLVNNVGMQHRAPLLEFPDAMWQRLVYTNLTSAFLVGREVAHGMVERARGKIVNVASMQSELARPGIAPYAATKGGLKMLTKGMCAEWGPSGVQAHTRPRLHRDRADPPPRRGRRLHLMGARAHPRRALGSRRRPRRRLLFLVAPASDFVNGHTLYVDGGMLAVV